MWVCDSTSVSYHKWYNSRFSPPTPPKRVCACRGDLLSSVTEVYRRTSGFGNVIGIRFFSLHLLGLLLFSFKKTTRSFQGKILSGSCAVGTYENSLSLLCLQKFQGSPWLGFLYHVLCCQPITGAGDCNVLIDVGPGHMLHPRAEGEAHSDPVDWKWGAARKGKSGSVAKKMKNVLCAPAVLPRLKINVITS